jgi:tight adherence protein B
MMDLMGWSLFLLAVVSASGIAFSIGWLGVDLLKPKRRDMAQRLADLHTAPLPHVDLQLLKHRPLSRLTWLDPLLREWPAARELDRLLQQTGWPLRVEHVGAAMAVATLIIVLGVLLLGLSWAWVPGLTVASWLVGWTVLRLQRRRRERAIESQLPDALDLIARAMQAGHALSSAILMAANEGPQPLADAWRTIFDEINFGIPTRMAIEDFSERVDSEYVRLFVVSTLIQMETGGNMAEILHNTAKLIRERQQLQASVKVLSAEGRVSALILSTLPFALGIVLALINPGFVAVLWTDPLGLKMLLGALALMLLGVFWMWRMIDIAV